MRPPLTSDNLSGKVVIDHMLRPVERTGLPPQDALTPSQTAQDAIQTQYEYQKAYRALHQAEERLEMYGRPDMAREVRTIRSRLALGR
jgi:hypothetical protein